VKTRSQLATRDKNDSVASRLRPRPRRPAGTCNFATVAHDQMHDALTRISRPFSPRYARAGWFFLYRHPAL